MDTKTQPRYHFIGIGGVGMSALARLVLQQGSVVSGSDANQSAVTQSLSQSGVQIHEGHAAHQVPHDAVVIYSSDIPAHNCELEQANQNNAKILHRAALLAQVMQSKQALTVAGTHGKTTTTALLSWVLQQANYAPSFAIGGFFHGTTCNSAYGTGKHFVAEADESDGSFLEYNSFGSIVTNVDEDHLPYFKTYENIEKSFSQFMNKVKCSDLLFWCLDDAGLFKMSKKGMIPSGVSYGWHPESVLRGMDYRQEGWNSYFSCKYKGEVYRAICLPLPGRYAALNALAVFGMALTLGIEERVIREAFMSFPGVERRFTVRGEVRSILVIDDYGHHPTEIRAALEAVRGAIGSRRLIAMYQPHRYSRTRDCLGTYEGAFDAADHVLVTEIYGSGEPAIQGVTHTAIVQELESYPKGPTYKAINRQAWEEELFALLRPHDVVVCLAAGDLTSFSKQLPTLLEKRPVTPWNLAVLCGGPSSEHSISLLSMQQLLSKWNRDYYRVQCFGITQKGFWIDEKTLLEQLEANKATPQSKLTEPKRAERLPPSLLTQLLKCDMVVPILHGEWGEDGTIQGFCEVLNLPYIGCDVRSSAICLDKSLMKALCIYHGVPTIPSLVLPLHAWKNKEDLSERLKQLGDFPYWIKPAHLGSSVGVARVCNAEQLQKGLDVIFELDDVALIEKEMIGRELECAVLGNDDIEVFAPGEVLTEVLPYDYEGKYCSEATPTKEIAELSADQAQSAMELSKRVYKLLGCKGLARVDLFLDSENNCWLNEVNTLPGFTRNSLYPRMCEANGLPISTLLDRLVILGLQAARTRSKRHLG